MGCLVVFPCSSCITMTNEMECWNFQKFFCLGYQECLWVHVPLTNVSSAVLQCRLHWSDRSVSMVKHHWKVSFGQWGGKNLIPGVRVTYLHRFRWGKVRQSILKFCRLSTTPPKRRCRCLRRAMGITAPCKTKNGKEKGDAKWRQKWGNQSLAQAASS